ncbi:MAG: DNA primase [Ruminococcus sp.]|jgi:DNA primase|nr:DNA primase [Ruminococcus sp.]
MINPDFINELKSRCRIEDIMGRSVALKRSGREMICLCPFHAERTPSCSVNVTEQYFHCFGCGAGGDVITFLMRYENLEYIEALRELAGIAGMELPENSEDKGTAMLKAQILEANRAAARFWYEELKNAPEALKARRYITERKLFPKTVTKFGLGYAANSWDKLYKHLRGDFDNEILEAAQLIRRNPSGGCYDVFRDRLIFPIIDTRGGVIGFGGRIIDGEGPKYYNTTETPVFHKGNNLYSYGNAKKSGERTLILCEGYMDVISVFQAGFENAVATLGTALTPAQAKLMSRIADEVIISYDSDTAGQAAAAKAINLLSENGTKTRIVNMRPHKDPDEFIKANGAEAFSVLLKKSENAIKFRIEKCADGLAIDDEADKPEYIRRVCKILAEINSKIEREVYIGYTAEKTRVNRQIIEAEVNRLRKAQVGENEARRFSNAAKNVNIDPKIHAEEVFIAYLLFNQNEIKTAAAIITPEQLPTESGKEIYKGLTKFSENLIDFDIFSVFNEYDYALQDKITAEYVKYKGNPPKNEDFDSAVKVMTKPRKTADELTDDDLRTAFTQE